MTYDIYDIWYDICKYEKTRRFSSGGGWFCIGLLSCPWSLFQSPKVLPWYWTFCTMALGCTDIRLWCLLGRFDRKQRETFFGCKTEVSE